MSRPLRIEIEGGWYHVISRGIERREIFRDDPDRRDFMERLFGLTESHAVVVHGYCLMGNHFHLQLQTVRPNLKEAMQKLLSGYAVRFNLRHRRAGPLFQGRYRAILLGEGEWLSEVNRYIHLNPVRVESLQFGKQKQAEIRRGIEEPAEESLVSRRLEALRTFPWSSYRAYAGYIKGPAELKTDEVLGCFEGDSPRQQEALGVKSQHLTWRSPRRRVPPCPDHRALKSRADGIMSSAEESNGARSFAMTRIGGTSWSGSLD